MPKAAHGDTAMTDRDSPPTAKAKPEAPEKRHAIRRRSPKWLIWLGILLAVALGIWAYASSRTPTAAEVQTVSVTRGTVRDFVTSIAAGRVASENEVAVRAEIVGKVAKVHVKRGQRVELGEPLITYDAEELKERVTAARSAVDTAKAQERQSEQAAVNARTDLARARRLRESNAIPVAEFERIEGQSAVMERSAEAARAAVRQANANVELALTALERTVVRASSPGTVLDTHIDSGEISVLGGPLVDIADLGSLHVDAEIDEADLGRIRVGMAADVALDAFPNERLRGKLVAIAPSVNRDTRGGRSVAIDISLPNDARLRVGMSADVDIIVDSHDDVLFLPPNAVVGRGTDRSVYLVKDGIAHVRKIDVGISTWEAVEIQKGLEEHDVVVSTLSARNLEDGAHVRVEAQTTP